MYKRVVFNVGARNCDDDTKNFAFLMETQGKWILAPSYDICFAYRPDSVWVSHHNLSINRKCKVAPAYDICFAYRPDSVWVSQHHLSINGKRKNFERKDLISIAEQNSIRNPEKIIDQALDLVKNWKQYAAMYQVDPILAQQI